MEKAARIPAEQNGHGEICEDCQPILVAMQKPEHRARADASDAGGEAGPLRTRTRSRDQGQGTR